MITVNTRDDMTACRNMCAYLYVYIYIYIYTHTEYNRHILLDAYTYAHTYAYT